MSKGQIRLRLWMASLALGVLISLSLTAMVVDGRYAYWLPGIQPGWLLAWGVSTFLHKANQSLWPLLITAGNTLFYTLFCSRLLSADIESHGRLSRFLIS